MSGREIKERCKASSEHYRLLADEIIIKAAKEFKHAYKNNLKENLEELTSFFLGKWYKNLTTIPGDKMLDLLKKDSSRQDKEFTPASES